MKPFSIEVRWTPLGDVIVEFVPLFKGRTRVTKEDLRESWLQCEDGLRAFEAAQPLLAWRARNGQVAKPTPEVN